jgi:hypothetical protein
MIEVIALAPAQGSSTWEIPADTTLHVRVGRQCRLDSSQQVAGGKRLLEEIGRTRSYG